VSEYSTEHKVPPYELRYMAHFDEDFYAIMGPFFGSKDAARELGEPIWDEPERDWVVAVSEGRALGCVAVRKNDYVCSLYVEPGSRGKLIGYALLRAALDLYGGKRATATPHGAELFALFGFKEVGTKGSYLLMARDDV
jgi:GNAT superfamily N-acetyltransferase